MTRPARPGSALPESRPGKKEKKEGRKEGNENGRQIVVQVRVPE